ncbi:MAG: YhjD/YihY/BrkB family envelope integrity protein, partial [Desulfohalobium sp.]
MWNIQRYKKLPRLLTAIREWAEFIIRAFFRDQCLLRASALTYVTALALVPFLAVAFSLSKGFGFQNTVYIRTLLERFATGREEVIDHVLTYINNTDVGTLGSIGVAVLFISVFTMLANVEKTFNTIWGVQRPRQLSRKFTDYLSVIVLCPVLVIASLSATASLQSSAVAQKLLSVGVVDSVFGLLLKLTPFFMAWLALVFIYTVMPNTRVRLFPAFTGALVAGFLWQGTQKALIHYQIGFSKYNAIYGSFAQVPLLLLWMHVSWIIVLFGAEISFALQNRNAVLRSNQGGDSEPRDTHVLALAITSLLARAALEGKRPPVLE